MDGEEWVERRSRKWIKQMCVFMKTSEIGTLILDQLTRSDSAGTVWSREARGHWTQIRCRKGRIIRKLERKYRNRWGGGGDMCGREGERGRGGRREAVSVVSVKWSKCKTKAEREEWLEKDKLGRQKKKREEQGRKLERRMGGRLDGVRSRWERWNADSGWAREGDEEMQKLGGRY